MLPELKSQDGRNVNEKQIFPNNVLYCIIVFSLTNISQVPKKCMAVMVGRIFYNNKNKNDW